MRQQRQSKEAWEKILAELSDYPGTQSEFCQSHGITFSSLRYYLSRRDKHEREISKGPESLAAFVAVGRAGQSSVPEGIEVSIGRITLRVRSDTDLTTLRLALQAAVEVCGRT